MKYNIQLPLNFQQLLNLILQLPKVEQKRLVQAIENEEQSFPKIEMKTIAQIKNKNYQYTRKDPQKIVGIWENEEAIDNYFAKY